MFIIQERIFEHSKNWTKHTETIFYRENIKRKNKWL